MTATIIEAEPRASAGRPDCSRITNAALVRSTITPPAIAWIPADRLRGGVLGPDRESVSAPVGLMPSAFFTLFGVRTSLDLITYTEFGSQSMGSLPPFQSFLRAVFNERLDYLRVPVS
jgi:hypothetical protein